MTFEQQTKSLMVTLFLVIWNERNGWMDADCISLPVLVTCAMTIQLNSILFFSSNNCTHSPLITLIPDNFTPLIFPGLL